MGGWQQDVRYAFRSLGKSPLFVTVALLSLALGIGANSAIFSLMDQALVRSLPVQHPEQLVLFSSPGPRRGHMDANYGDKVTFSYPAYIDLRDRNQVFSGTLARFPVNFSLSWRERTERINGELVSGNYFDVLGVRAAIGRTLLPEDDRLKQTQPVAVLSYAYWKSRFNADPSILNQTILLNNHPLTVVGVADRGFKSVGTTEAPQVFVPLTMEAQAFEDVEQLESRHSMWLNIFARLKPGTSREQAEASANLLWRPLLEQEAADFKDMSQAGRERYVSRHLSLEQGARGVSGIPPEFTAGMEILVTMVGVLLLIACANVANLLIARATSRRKEIGIRVALGAGRGRIVRQLMVESLTLALGGGALGVLVAAWTGQALLAFLPSDPQAAGISSDPDHRVLLFTLVLSLATGVVFGLIPSLQTARQGVADTLKQTGSAVIGGHLGLRKGLVVLQVTLSLVLLIMAGLLTRSMHNVRSIDAGFPTDHLISFAVQPSFSGYDQPRALAFFAQLQEAIAAVPGVRAVSMGQTPVLSGDNNSSGIEVIGQVSKEGEDNNAGVNFVGPGYLATIGIPLLAGRDINAGDTAASAKVAVVNEEVVKHYFGSENPIGRRFRFRRGDAVIEIVGVVRETKHMSLREARQRFIYCPYTQYATNPPMTFYARTSQDPLSVAGELRKQVRQLDPNLPVFQVKTLDQQIDESIFTDRLLAALSTAFGTLATMLAAIGLYGVMAYVVVRRTREIGIRMALGADRQNVVHLVLTEIVLLAFTGIAIALAVAAAIGRILRSQLFGVSGNDISVFALATAILAAVALLAGYLPALRASRIDPTQALRYE